LPQVPELAMLGALFKSCEPVRLTEEDTEYSIFCAKHIFDSHVVFQFDCTNTIQEQVLENVTVNVDLADAVGGHSSAPVNVNLC
jgi:coatomer protein complex subunit gamma